MGVRRIANTSLLGITIQVMQADNYLSHTIPQPFSYHLPYSNLTTVPRIVTPSKSK